MLNTYGLHCISLNDIRYSIFDDRYEEISHLEYFEWSCCARCLSDKFLRRFAVRSVQGKRWLIEVDNLKVREDS